MKREPRICIAGMGAIGSLLAASLSSRPVNLSLVARGETLRTLQQNGLTCRKDGQVTTFRVSADIRAPDEIQDVILLAGKAHHLPDLVQTIRHAVGPETCVVPVVNGVPWWLLPQLGIGPEAVARVNGILDPENRLSALPPTCIVGCVAYAFARVEKPGEVSVEGPSRFVIGDAVGGSNTQARTVMGWLGEKDTLFQISTDMKTEIWNKLSLNVATNFLSVLCETTLEGLVTDAAIRPLVSRCLSEILMLGQACSIERLFPVPKGMEIISAGGTHATSMLQDFHAGRPLELAALGDVIIALGRHKSVPLTTTETLLGLTRYASTRRNTTHTKGTLHVH
ncbi:MAG: 2-dehydropantoate 2-reductase N-terminal domain-containing protein [Acetobacter aceti]|uniref:2-dehydropantoate 2-reductase n=1 Tax=Acetobacter aceti TaxID=435 RepID=A0A1U9KLA0_ACEAC|nr:2-dehydropantoate 2-reductase N-terminal domain-containing protein [Acetobacter aceti]AQS86570.1 hypothetical protein A0U92_15765 [Acetobacter aceti]